MKRDCNRFLVHTVQPNLTSYLFKVARGLAFASSHLVEEEPCSGVSFDKKNVRKQTFVRYFQKERFPHFLSITHSPLNHLFNPFIPLITHSLDQSIIRSINISHTHTLTHPPEILNIVRNSPICNYQQVYRSTNQKIKNVETLLINWLGEERGKWLFFHEVLQMNASSQ